LGVSERITSISWGKESDFDNSGVLDDFEEGIAPTLPPLWQGKDI
jgi:hypothetical protein